MATGTNADESNDSALPSTLSGQVVGIPAAYVPATLRALDRLVGEAVGIPAAWLAQQKARIEAKTASLKIVESCIAAEAAKVAASNDSVTNAAASVLVRKEYRRLSNLEAVAAKTAEALREDKEASQAQEPTPEPDEEWLNVFERYAQEASTERMRTLWGRVLAGQIRRPGQFSMRSLRFLSEFSQEDASLFSEFMKNVFGPIVPKKLHDTHNGVQTIKHLLDLQAADLVDGANGLGLTLTLTIADNGFIVIDEGNIGLLLKGEPQSKIEIQTYNVTPIGIELSRLLDRDSRQAAKNVARAIRSPALKSAHIVIRAGDHWMPVELLWDEQTPQT